jgi:PTS system nitrogen regulatory IIA component
MMFSIREAARFFEVPVSTIVDWIEDRALPAYRLNGQYRFNRAELIEWATVTGTRASPDLLAGPYADDSLPDVAGALEAGGIFHGLKCDSREKALRAIVDLLRLPPSADRTSLLQVLLAREALGSTGVGAGIAIPHPRQPIVLDEAGPMVTLCFLEKAVDFGALDGEPVSVLFTLISPTARAHLHLLSRLASILHDAAFLKALKERRAAGQIIQAARAAEAKIARAPR